MTSLAKTTLMSKPIGGEKVSDWTLEFFRQRNRNHVHSLVLAAMKKFGISQAEIARRLGRRPDVVCRWIGAPGNWTLDTVSDLLFAINGLEVAYQTADPFNQAKRNFSSPEWLLIPSCAEKTVGMTATFSSSLSVKNSDQIAISGKETTASASSRSSATFSIPSQSKQLESVP